MQKMPISLAKGEFPVYTYPLFTLGGLAFSVLFSRRRSFRQDSLACVRRLMPPLQVQGGDCVPRRGPCLVVFNHYYRPGFPSWWMALALAATIPQEIHFVMTSELTFPGKWYSPLGAAGSRWLLRRLARVYGFTTMPPMPPRPCDVTARARSVRRVLAFARANAQAILALAPEGGDPPDGILHWPPPGVGRFLALLVEAGYPIVPVGIYEADGRLCLHFGHERTLSWPAASLADERDRCVAEQTMRAIARQLPARLRGAFADEEVSESQFDRKPPRV